MGGGSRVTVGGSTGAETKLQASTAKTKMLMAENGIPVRVEAKVFMLVSQ